MGYSAARMQKPSRIAFPVCLAVATMFAVVLVAQTAPTPQGPGPVQGAAPGRGRAAAPVLAKQPGHGTGKLIIWGDTALFDTRANPDNCILLNRFKRGMRMGFRMTAIDGGTGETEQTAVITAHVTYNGRTVDEPMRYRGADGPNVPAPRGYVRPPVELWTGFWVVPQDAMTGIISYTMTAIDAFGRTASFRVFPDEGSQTFIVD